MLSVPFPAENLSSLLSQPVTTLLAYAKSPIASHLLDLVLTHSAVHPKYRRKLILAFLGKYRDLAEDRMGSRVADTIWDVADGFLKVCASIHPLFHSIVIESYN
jgi:nucleolar protein 9